MADPRKRATASLKVKYKSTTLAQFMQQFGLDISHAGIFIKTKSALEPGALLRLELQLSDATPVIQGSGRVQWRRLPGPEGALPAGMGIEFIRLEADSRALVDRIVDAREGRPSRYEQSDDAEHISASQPLASTLASSIPPRGLPSLAPVSPTPAPSAAKPIPPAPPPAASAPPRTSLSPVKAPPSEASGLFATSNLRANTSLMPGPQAPPAQSSFFSSTRTSSPQHVAFRAPSPAPPRPPPPAVITPAAEDEVTGQFREHAADVPAPLELEPHAPQAAADEVDDNAITGQLDPPEAQADEPFRLMLSIPPAPTSGLSSLQPPARSRSTTLVWAIVIALVLIGAIFAFFHARRTPAAGQGAATAAGPTRA